MKKKTGFILCGVCVILLAAVLLFSKKQEGGADKDMLYVENMGEFAAEDGFYYLDSGRFLRFYDDKLGQSAIVCGKPNCAHQAWQESTPAEQRCDAYAFFCHSLFVYRGKLYLAEQVSGAEKMRLVESEPDRSGQRVVAEIDSEYIGFYVIKDGSMYFCTLNSETKKDETGMPVQTGLSNSSLCRLDLETGKTEIIKEMEQHYNGQLLISGTYQDSVICCYGYFKEKYTGFNYEEAQRQLKWYLYDVKNNTFQESCPELTDIDIGHCEMDKDKLIYAKWRDYDGEKSDIYCYDFGAAENVKLIPDSHTFSVDDHKVLARGYDESKCLVYDLMTGEAKELVQKDKKVHVQAEYGDHFIVASYEDGVSSYGVMKKSDYYEGRTDFRLLDQDLE